MSERLLEARLAGAPTHVPAPGPVPNDTLVVERDARWFRAPGAEAVGLTGKHLSRRLLLRLVRGRLEAPGESIVVESLLEAGWPGERIHPDAAKNRLFVALNTLRKLGLAPFLESVGGGYRLDPKVPLRLG